MANLNILRDWVGSRCHFCHTILTYKDQVTGNIMISALDHAAHKDCLEFIMAKHPSVPMADLEGKISRVKVDLSHAPKVL